MGLKGERAGVEGGGGLVDVVEEQQDHRQTGNKTGNTPTPREASERRLRDKTSRPQADRQTDRHGQQEQPP